MNISQNFVIYDEQNGETHTESVFDSIGMALEEATKIWGKMSTKAKGKRSFFGVICGVLNSDGKIMLEYSSVVKRFFVEE